MSIADELNEKVLLTLLSRGTMNWQTAAMIISAHALLASASTITLHICENSVVYMHSTAEKKREAESVMRCMLSTLQRLDAYTRKQVNLRAVETTLESMLNRAVSNTYTSVVSLTCKHC
jgi:hypothetical protein